MVGGKTTTNTLFNSSCSVYCPYCNTRRYYFQVSFHGLLNGEMYVTHKYSTHKLSFFFRSAFELGHHEWFALRRLITKKEMLHIPGFLKFCSSRNLTSGGATVKEMDIWKATPRDNVLLEISNGAPISRWLTDESDHNKNYNFSSWRDNVPTFLCCFLAAIHNMFTE